MIKTNCMILEDVIAMLNNEIPPYETTIEEAMVFLKKEIEFYMPKISEKKAKKIKEDNNYKEKIINLLTATPEGMTCSDILKNIPELLDNYSVSKVSSLCKTLIEENKVKREVRKGKAYFSLI